MYTDQYVSRDIDKAIYYYSGAAIQNNSDAQFALGFIYGEGQYISRDIDKAIHYLTLAADQNNSDAQYSLGVIYYTGQYIPRYIDKAIYYFSLSSEQYNTNALFTLGVIYYEGQYTLCDINKAMKYFSLTADQKNSDAHLIILVAALYILKKQFSGIEILLQCLILNTFISMKKQGNQIFKKQLRFCLNHHCIKLNIHLNCFVSL